MYCARLFVTLQGKKLREIMLYAIAHFLRDKMPCLWDLVDVINSCFFSLRYGRKLKDIEEIVIKKYNEVMGYKICRMREVDASMIADFFAKQPEEAFTYFKPHGFDVKSIRKLQRNKSFLAYLLIDKEKDDIVSYCFNRSFFHGKGFRGRMVDADFRGKGLGTAMNRLLNDVAFGIGLRLFETVSKDNLASYRSAMSASNVRVLKELENNDLFLEIVQP